MVEKLSRLPLKRKPGKNVQYCSCHIEQHSAQRDAVCACTLVNHYEQQKLRLFWISQTLHISSISAMQLFFFLKGYIYFQWWLVRLLLKTVTGSWRSNTCPDVFEQSIQPTTAPSERQILLWSDCDLTGHLWGVNVCMFVNFEIIFLQSNSNK